MKRSNSTRRQTGLRRPQSIVDDNLTISLDEFEDVALDSTSIPSRSSTPALRRGNSPAPTITKDTSSTHDSTSSTNKKTPHDLRQASLLTATRSNGLQPEARSTLAPSRDLVTKLAEGNDSDDSIPETVIFDNIPLSPQAQTSPPAPQPVQRHPVSAPPAGLTRTMTYQESLLNDMDADTRELTAQLNDHAERLVTAQSLEHSALLANKSLRSRADRKASAKAIVHDLRPILDDRIEALPISKEKEAALTCTRPTFLPPKSRKEEKKHLKEYEKLMLGSFEAEKKSQKRRSKALATKAKHLTNSVDTWTDQIIPHFSTAIKDARTKHLWWSGLPNRVRGRVWSICVGNTLSVTEETFRVALAQSLRTEAELKSNSGNDSDGDNFQLLTLASYTLLDESVSRTFVDLNIFQKGGPLHEPLVQVLKAYLYYRQDVMVSYMEGVNYIAGLLLLYLSPVESFIILVNVLNRALPLAIYTRDEPVLNRFVAVFLKKLAERLPRLHKHLHQELRLAPLLYLEPMLVCFLAKQAPIDVSSRIFDVYAFEGDSFLLRATLACFTVLEHALYGSARDVMLVLCGNDREHVWRNSMASEDEFMKLVQSIRL